VVVLVWLVPVIDLSKLFSGGRLVAMSGCGGSRVSSMGRSTGWWLQRFCMVLGISSPISCLVFALKYSWRPSILCPLHWSRPPPKSVYLLAPLGLTVLRTFWFASVQRSRSFFGRGYLRSLPWYCYHSALGVDWRSFSGGSHNCEKMVSIQLFRICDCLIQTLLSVAIMYSHYVGNWEMLVGAVPW
jgi:hypothetical protein